MNEELNDNGFEVPSDGDDLDASTPDRADFFVQEPGGPYRTIRDFTELRVWQLAMDLAASIYRLTRSFPSEVRFGLVSQLRRAAVSIPSNIAEGNARNSTADYLRFLRMSRGSLAEVKTQLLLAARLGMLEGSVAAKTLQEVDDLMRQLTAMYTAIERSATRTGRME